MTATVRRTAIDLAGLEVPVIEVTGSGDGPLLTVIAGVHGCEYVPMAAVRQWAGGLAGRELAGTVRAVPVLNLPAFNARSPFVVPEDGKNLNRNFPGDPAGSFTERFADAVFRTLISGSDAGGDAHCGDLPQAREPSPAPTRLNRCIWRRSEHDGWWEPVVAPGEQVARGQLLGTVTSLDG